MEDIAAEYMRKNGLVDLDFQEKEVDPNPETRTFVGVSKSIYMHRI